MGNSFSKMKKQAKAMEDQLRQLTDNLKNIVAVGSAGGGLVEVTLNGEKELKKIKIAPECLEDAEGLEDLIFGAFEEAYKKVESESKTLSIPGMPSFGL